MRYGLRAKNNSLGEKKRQRGESKIERGGEKETDVAGVELRPDFDCGERVVEELAPELLPMLKTLEMPANFVPATNEVRILSPAC